MKEEIGHLPGSSSIVCQCCRNILSWSETWDGDRYKYSRSTREYICDACVRDSKINAILSSN
jgi:hypothetical protein